jgi:RNA polymerase primary sigma factor
MSKSAYKMGSSRSSADVDGTARSYFRRMHSIPLLTKQQEVKLARDAEAGQKELLLALAGSPMFEEGLREIVSELQSDGGGQRAGQLRTALRRVGDKKAVLSALEKAGLPEQWPGQIAEAHADLVRLAASSEKNRRWVHRNTGTTLRELKRVHKRIRAAQERIREAKCQLTEANLRLVVFVAKRFCGMGLSLNDLVQEGNIGLMRAVDKFDYTRENRFATYAVHWIRQSIVRAIADQSRVIRIPVNKFHSAYKIGRASQQLRQLLGRRPTAEELAEELEIPLERVRSVREETRGTVSLEVPICNEGTLSLADCIEDESSPCPSAESEERELASRTQEVLATLSPREERILRLRFGIDDDTEHTLREIGKDFDITRERVRQIESQALQKLRHKSRSWHLESFAGED